MGITIKGPGTPWRTGPFHFKAVFCTTLCAGKYGPGHYGYSGITWKINNVELKCSSRLGGGDIKNYYK